MNGIDYLLTAVAALRGNSMRGLLTTLGIVFEVTSTIAELA